MSKIKVRRFETSDAEKVSSLIRHTLMTINIKDYSSTYIENLVKTINPESIIEKADKNHFYVLVDEGKIKACGAIGYYGNSLDETYFFSIFVDSEYQGLGYGRIIIDTLEKDEYFIKSKRIEVPASLTAVDFYMKMGYKYKNNLKEIDDLGLIRLEKFN